MRNFDGALKALRFYDQKVEYCERAIEDLLERTNHEVARLQEELDHYEREAHEAYIELQELDPEYNPYDTYVEDARRAERGGQE